MCFWQFFPVPLLLSTRLARVRRKINNSISLRFFTRDRLATRHLLKHPYFLRWLALWMPFSCGLWSCCCTLPGPNHWCWTRFRGCRCRAQRHSVSTPTSWRASVFAGPTKFSSALDYFLQFQFHQVFLRLSIQASESCPLFPVIDASLYNVSFEHMKLGGIMLIMFAFIITLLPENWNQYLGDILRSKLAKWKRQKGMKNGARVQDTSTAQLSRLRTPSGRVK